MDKLISSFQLLKQVVDISLEGFETFLYVDIDKKYQKHIPFTQALHYKCVDSLDTIMAHPDAVDNYNIFLRDKMMEPPLLKDQITSQCNYVLVVVIALSILFYAQNKRFNIIQRVDTPFAFANNSSKRFVELFHQIGTFVSYKSLFHGSQTNTNTVIEAILEKTRTHQFFISYDIMNFYANIYNQKIFKRNAFVSYIAEKINILTGTKLTRDLSIN